MVFNVVANPNTVMRPFCIGNQYKYVQLRTNTNRSPQKLQFLCTISFSISKVIVEIDKIVQIARPFSYLSNTPTNLCMLLLNFSLFCFVLYCYAFVQYCNVKTIQYNAMHKFVGVLDNPHHFSAIAAIESKQTKLN